MRADASGQDWLERQIERWRAHVRTPRTITRADTDELEDHLREQIASLCDDGLSEDEAFLVAVKRMGAIDALTQEFAREHADRLWKQLVLSGDGGSAGDARATGQILRMRVAIGLAVAAAVAIKLPALFGIDFASGRAFYPLNMAFFILPFIAAYFAWERPVPRADRVRLAVAFALSAIVVNAFPFVTWPGADTGFLTTLHLPIALWWVVGVAYVGGRWRGASRRMDFIRFTGELVIYYVLIALGGAVLLGLAVGLFGSIGLDVEPQLEGWLLPCGMVGAAVVATWLVEAKQSVIENIAPVLARIFAPLFTLLLLAFVATMAWTGRGIDVGREVLIAFDLLLAVVLGLFLYAVSARDPLAPPRFLDQVQLAMIGVALVLDVLALWAIGNRISDGGLTPNRVAALGLNLVLLANLAGSALLYTGFLRGDVPFVRLGAWQTSYLYVLAAWAAVVALLFPPLFGFA